ncbi:hypothetical protein V7S76_12910 [Aquirufa sp. ROCK2-A2]
MENWVWKIQWSPFQIKQVRLIENEVIIPELIIAFQEKLAIKPAVMPQIEIKNLSIDGSRIENKPNKINITCLELKSINTIDLSQLNP